MASSMEGKIMVIVDPWSTGTILAKEFLDREIPVMAIWTYGEFACNQERYMSNIVFESLEATMEQIQKLGDGLLGIIPGAESGVILADQLAFEFQTRMNPFDLSLARRNKYLMGETVRAAGVRAVEQTIATEWSQVKEFLDAWNPSPYKVIVKPNQSAGSDDVFLCLSEEKVKEAFDHINGAINHLGIVNEGVLIQEYLEGEEYVVDTISQDGEHKVCALWRYDKRSANEQFNVYFGTRPVAVTGELERSMVEYIFEVLDALKFENGPGHAEIKVTPRGPVLIEIGSRCHGAGGVWQEMSNRAFGWNQITRTCEIFTKPEAFAEYPTYPTEMIEYAINLHMVSYQSGVVDAMPGVEMLSSIPSFNHLVMETAVGKIMTPTIDIFSSPGMVQLIHTEEAQVQRDYDYIHQMLLSGFFNVVSSKQAEFETRPQPQEA